MLSQQSSLSGTRTERMCQLAIAATEASSLGPSKMPAFWMHMYSVPERFAPRRWITWPLPSTNALPDTRSDIPPSGLTPPSAVWTVNDTDGPSCQVPAVSWYVGKAYQAPVGSAPVKGRMAATVWLAPGFKVSAPEAGAKSSYGPLRLVPPGGRPAMTMFCNDIGAAPVFVYVTVAVAVCPSVTGLGFSARERLMTSPPSPPEVTVPVPQAESAPSPRQTTTLLPLAANVDLPHCGTLPRCKHAVKFTLSGGCRRHLRGCTWTHSPATGRSRLSAS